MQGKAVLQPAAAVRSILRAAQKLPESRKPEMPYGRETVSGFPTDTTDPIFQIEIFPMGFWIARFYFGKITFHGSAAHFPAVE